MHSKSEQRINTLVNVAGNSVGMLTGSLGVAIGIGTFVQNSEIAYALVGVLGGGYLIYLGSKE